MIDILAQEASAVTSHELWIALGGFATFSVFIVKWILNYMAKQAEQAQEREEQRIKLETRKVTAQIQGNNAMASLATSLDKHMEQEIDSGDKMRKSIDGFGRELKSNTQGLDRLCNILNKRFGTDSFQKADT